MFYVCEEDLFRLDLRTALPFGVFAVITTNMAVEDLVTHARVQTQTYPLATRKRTSQKLKARLKRKRTRKRR